NSDTRCITTRFWAELELGADPPSPLEPQGPVLTGRKVGAGIRLRRRRSEVQLLRGLISSALIACSSELLAATVVSAASAVLSTATSVPRPRRGARLARRF